MATTIGDFLRELASPLTGEELFDHLLDVVYFIKDADGRYLVVNKTLATRCRVKDKRSLLGRTPIEVLGDPLGRLFAEQDQRVLATGLPLLNQLELHLYPSGEIGWCLTTKLPLRNARGKVVGLTGVSQDLRIPNVESREYEQVASAIRYAGSRLANPPSVKELARVANMSLYQLDRRVQRVFGLTTGQWLLKSRIDRAQRLLQESELGISEIALEVGYADQGAFSRQFRAATGLTPRTFRAATQENNEAL